jgi:hypothetical protein
MLTTFWGSLGFDSGARRPGQPHCDHYRAIPLSDGHHVLFIDPPSGRLALGCDAPLGGPTKLIRKVVFVPPNDNAIPRLYAAAADLSQGACVVIAYGDTIMLYSIPSDVIVLSQTEQNAATWDVYTSPPFSTEGRSKDHWLNWWDEPAALAPANTSEATDTPSSIWPLAIRGTQIGTLKGICELAVQTQPDITIWACTHASHCKTWRLNTYADPVLREKQHICRDGLVHDSYCVDDAGDVIMQDAPAPESVAIDLHVQGEQDEQVQAERSVVLGFDGHASGVLKRMPGALAVENDEWVDFVDVRGCSDAWYEEGGDVVVFWGMGEG